MVAPLDGVLVLRTFVEQQRVDPARSDYQGDICATDLFGYKPPLVRQIMALPHSRVADRVIRPVG